MTSSWNKKVYSAFSNIFAEKCSKEHCESKESRTLKDRKTHVQLGHWGPLAVDLLAVKFAAALCYFASSCLCKIGLEIWQLMKTVQQNKRLAKNISKVDLKKAVKAGCMQNLWLSLTKDSYSAISWTPMPLRHKHKGKLYKAYVTSSTEISYISKA